MAGGIKTLIVRLGAGGGGGGEGGVTGLRGRNKDWFHDTCTHSHVLNSSS